MTLSSDYCIARNTLGPCWAEHTYGGLERTEAQNQRFGVLFVLLLPSDGLRKATNLFELKCLSAVRMEIQYLHLALLWR